MAGLRTWSLGTNGDEFFLDRANCLFLVWRGLFFLRIDEEDAGTARCRALRPKHVTGLRQVERRDGDVGAVAKEDSRVGPDIDATLPHTLAERPILGEHVDAV